MAACLWIKLDDIHSRARHVHDAGSFGVLVKPSWIVLRIEGERTVQFYPDHNTVLNFTIFTSRCQLYFRRNKCYPYSISMEWLWVRFLLKTLPTEYWKKLLSTYNLSIQRTLYKYLWNYKIIAEALLYNFFPRR